MSGENEALHTSHVEVCDLHNIVNLDNLCEDAELLEWCAAYALSNGIVYLQNAEDRLACEVAPITVLPTKFSLRVYREAVRCSEVLNLITENCALNLEWMIDDVLSRVRDVDPFLKKIINLCERVYIREDSEPKRELGNDIRLNILRSDFLAHQDSDSHTLCAKHVETNTHAASFAGLSERVSKMHHIAVERLLQKDTFKYFQPSDLACRNNQSVQKQLAQVVDCDNRPAEHIAEALLEAHTIYCQRYRANVCKSDIDAGILFVVQTNERNEMDQRCLEQHMHTQNVRTRVIWQSLQSLYHLYETGLLKLRSSSIDVKTQASSETLEPGRLFLCYNKQWVEISVIYFRALYDPIDFQATGSISSENLWYIRELLEWSNAAKCPSLPAQLAGTKLVQARLTNEHTWKCFCELLPEDKRIDMPAAFMRQCEANEIHPKYEEYRDNAIKHSSQWVLKPQREGGGNNLFGDDVKKTLQNASNTELQEYILMERIRAPDNVNAFVFDRSRSATRAIRFKAASELGVYTVFTADGSQVYSDKKIGHLLRTKDHSTDEGGVCAGYSYIDSPMFT